MTATLKEGVWENTWNVGQAIVGRGLYTYWQYGQALADRKRDFDSSSFFVTSGYAFPLRWALPFLQAAPSYVREAWLASPAMAFQCPLLIKQLNDAVAKKKADDPKVKQGKELIAEARKLHDTGKHAESIAKADEAANLTSALPETECCHFNHLRPC